MYRIGDLIVINMYNSEPSILVVAVANGTRPNISYQDHEPYMLHEAYMMYPTTVSRAVSR